VLLIDTTMAADITYSRFTYRVVAVVAHHDALLLHRGAAEHEWSFPGGQVRAGERAADALQREIYEELGVTADIGPLAFVVENFYLDGKQRVHELGLYFQVTFSPDTPLLAFRGLFQGRELDKQLVFQWCALSALKSLPINPACVLPYLSSLPSHVVHLVEVAQL
jgi:8-oxo-dGTP pyrophosphatase MutT (NUDIX family)